MNKWIIPVMIAIVALLMPVSTATVSAQDGVGLSISKSAAPTVAAVGDTITYTYTITNTDNVTIGGLTLQDDLLGAIDLGDQTSLDAGGTMTITATYTVVAADLPGPLVNTAAISGTDPDSNPFSASTSAMVELSYTASLQLIKVAQPTTAAVGDSINYAFTITNDGPVTVSDIVLTDDQLGTIDLGGQTSLSAGGTITATATYTVVEADLPGPIANTATVSGTDPNGNPVSANATATVELSYTVSLQLNKTAQPTSAAVGDNITYTYTVTNNGPVTLDNLVLTDDQLSTIDMGGQTSLAAGGTITATATYTVVDTDLPGPIVNTATVSGTDPDNNTVTASATATVALNYQATLQLEKVAQPTSATVGDNITYSYTITNNGPVVLSGLMLTDDMLGTIDLRGQTSLNPGASIIVSTGYPVVEADLPGPLVNTATISGTDPAGNSITATDTATVELSGNAALQVTKNADRDSAAPGRTINYSYAVTNNGNVTVNELSLSDDKLGTLTLSSNTLAPGESATASASYAVTLADLPGPIVNTATVEGTSSDGQSISATSSQVSVSLFVNRWELFKAQILKLMGVPGKGIENAPGLQKPFNPKSQAAEHAGPKSNSDNTDSDEPEELQINQNEDNEGIQEQLQITEETQNQGAEEQLQVTNEVQNQTENGQAALNDTSSNQGKGQLKNGDKSNNGGGQANQGNGHQPDKDKKNNKSKSGK